MARVLLLGLPGTRGAFAFGFGNQLAGRVAGREQDFPGLVFLFAAEFGERLAKTFQPEIFLALSAFDAVKERGEFDELVAGVEKVPVEELLPFHKFLTLNIRRKSCAARQSPGVSFLRPQN